MEEKHKELGLDIGKLFLNFTPLSGPIATYKFIKKWWLDQHLNPTPTKSKPSIQKKPYDN